MRDERKMQFRIHKQTHTHMYAKGLFNFYKGIVTLHGLRYANHAANPYLFIIRQYTKEYMYLRSVAHRRILCALCLRVCNTNTQNRLATFKNRTPSVLNGIRVSV